MAYEFSSRESAACGQPPRRAYPPLRSCGRVAEGGGLLNRYRVVKPYRGFESLRLRQFDVSRCVRLRQKPSSNQIHPTALTHPDASPCLCIIQGVKGGNDW